MCLVTPIPGGPSLRRGDRTAVLLSLMKTWWLLEREVECQRVDTLASRIRVRLPATGRLVSGSVVGFYVLGGCRSGGGLMWRSGGYFASGVSE